MAEPHHQPVPRRMERYRLAAAKFHICSQTGESLMVTVQQDSKRIATYLKEWMA